MTLLNAAGGGPGVNAFGLPAMRQAVADLYTSGRLSGTPRVTTADEIHITSGAHQAIALLVASLAGRGQAVAFAEVNYPGIFDIVDGLEARPAPVRTDRAGMLPESLDEVIDRERPAALYVQAGPQQPDRHGDAAVARCAPSPPCSTATASPVIEDATLSALTFAGPPAAARRCLPVGDRRVRRLAEQDVLGRAAARLDARFGADRRADDVPPSRLRPRALGAVAAARPRAAAAARRDRRRAAPAARRRGRVRRRAAAGVDPRGRVLRCPTVAPCCGSASWSTTRSHSSAMPGASVCASLPGSIHVTGRVAGPYVRICVDRPIDHVGEGIDRLARAWRDPQRPRRRRPSARAVRMGLVVGPRQLLRDAHPPGVDDELAGLGRVERGEPGAAPSGSACRLSPAA